MSTQVTVTMTIGLTVENYYLQNAHRDSAYKTL